MRRFLVLAGLCLIAAQASQAADERPPVAKLPLHSCPYVRGGGAAGPVTVGFRITKEGIVTDAAIVRSSGAGEIDDAALACVKEWTYAPARRDDAAVDWPAQVTLKWERSEISFRQSAFQIPGHEYEEKVVTTNVTPEMAVAFNRLINDVILRCPLLYPVRPLDMDRAHSRNRVVVRRAAGGDIDAAISMSSYTHGADGKALACSKHLAAKHDDLPPTFAVEIEIDWALYYAP